MTVPSKIPDLVKIITEGGPVTS